MVCDCDLIKNWIIISFIYFALAAVTGGLIFSNVQILFLIKRISVIGCPQSVSDRQFMI